MELLRSALLLIIVGISYIQAEFNITAISVDNVPLNQSIVLRTVRDQGDRETTPPGGNDKPCGSSGSASAVSERQFLYTTSNLTISGLIYMGYGSGNVSASLMMGGNPQFTGGQVSTQGFLVPAVTNIPFPLTTPNGTQWTLSQIKPLLLLNVQTPVPITVQVRYTSGPKDYYQCIDFTLQPPVTSFAAVRSLDFLFLAIFVMLVMF
ncbi:hypothetical protein MIR68_006415 [Amoeboaphelidium protococcarum]|nr:hypothetical protein MIR68_006415 [Amoeboaphelidium protococcarum]